MRTTFLIRFVSVFFVAGLMSCGGGSSAGTATTTPTAPSPPAPAATSVTFPAHTEYPTNGNHPISVAVADFNGDGKPDIAVSNELSNTVAVFLNKGDGTFGAPVMTAVTVTNNIGAIASGDFNEDGKQDLVVATISGPQSNIVLLGNGSGGFTQQSPIPGSFGFFHARVIDINGDGHLDLVAGSNGSINVWLGHGDGTFTAAPAIPSGSFPGSYNGITVGDFNGDGKLDIVAADFGNTTPIVFYAGKGDGTFLAPVVTTLDLSDAGSLASADFDGDGKRDVLIGLPNAAIILSGNGDGTFNVSNASRTFVYVSNTSNGGVLVWSADIDGNGKPDPLAADFSGGVFTMVENSSSISNPPPNTVFQFTLSAGLVDVATGDFNGDGLADAVVVNLNTNQISVILSKK